MTARETATAALGLYERLEKQGLSLYDIAEVLVVVNALVQTRLNAQARERQAPARIAEPQDEG